MYFTVDYSYIIYIAIANMYVTIVRGTTCIHAGSIRISGLLYIDIK